MAHRLILASQSPRRQQLMQQAGLEFEVMPVDPLVEEGVSSSCPPEEYVRRTSYCKAQSVAPLVDHGLIVTADTIAECDGQKIGKPLDRNDAARMLRLMSGRCHRVLTGVTLWHRPSNVTASHFDQTVLEMDTIDESMLQSYLDTGDWVGKAGAFGYQDGLDWVHIQQGSATNVVGLPMEKLAVWLREMDDAIK